MISTQVSVSNQNYVSSAGGKKADQGATEPTESYQGSNPPGQGDNHGPAICPRPPRFEPAICPQPVVGFEPWQMGEPTSTPAVSPQFADKLVRNFGEQAAISIADERIAGVAGYYFDGLEGISPSQDWLSGVTTGRLGAGWEMKEYGTYELTNGTVGQTLKFDVANRQTTLESYYIDRRFEESKHSEIIRRNEDGSMTREQPPVGL